MTVQNPENFPIIRITRPAKVHLAAYVGQQKARNIPSVSASRVVSELILSLEIGKASSDPREIGVDFCPSCNTTLPVDGDECEVCRTPIIHMTAISTVELLKLRALAGRTTRVNE
jgi:hypothetical protein